MWSGKSRRCRGAQDIVETDTVWPLSGCCASLLPYPWLCMELHKNQREHQDAMSRHETGFPLKGRETNVSKTRTFDLNPTWHLIWYQPVGCGERRIPDKKQSSKAKQLGCRWGLQWSEPKVSFMKWRTGPHWTEELPLLLTLKRVLVPGFQDWPAFPWWALMSILSTGEHQRAVSISVTLIEWVQVR